ncbi:hypothetical protein PVAG01_03722 [Phlyctema vagabunda]|uniref:YCII-related domain-containing protein n=1 Tax=Phlyctema vagabunda TaxID=108571 RepID=A0ABR4PM76_9HELO
MAMPPTIPSGKFEWLVILPDHEGVLDHRMKVRPAHFEGLGPVIESGLMKMGGALLEEVPKEGEAMKINGSALVAVAANREEVLEIIKRDTYTKEGIWDMSKVQIYPFKAAFYKP